MSGPRPIIIILAVCWATFFTQLGRPRLWDRDEPRNARCAEEMLLRRDWIVPTFNGELRTHKPVLLYWCMMSAYQLFGVNEFAARFSSALLAVGTVLATYAIGRRMFQPRIGFWAAIVLATTLMFNVAARAATPDSSLIFCSTLAFAAFVHTAPTSVWRGEQVAMAQPQAFVSLRFGPAIVVYAAMAAAVLAKGPVGVVLPTATIGLFTLLVTQPRPVGPEGARSRWGTRIRQVAARFHPMRLAKTVWALRPITALVATGLIAGPWYYLVGVRTNGEWLRGFFWDHNLSRAVSPMEGHDGSLLFYPVALLIGTFPWSVLAIPVVLAIRQTWSERKARPAFTLLLCWIGVYITVFSCAQTKLPSYITPTYPAVALLVGCFLYQWERSVSGATDSWSSWTRWPTISALTLASIGLILIIALPIAAHLLLPGDEIVGLLGLIPLVGGMAMWNRIRRNAPAATVRILAVSAALFIVGLFGFVAPRIGRHQQIEGLLRLAQADGHPASIAAFGSQEPSWVFYAKRVIPLIPEEQTQRAAAFLQADPTRFLITTTRHLPQLESQLPPGVVVRGRIPYFLRKDSILLLGRAPVTSHHMLSETSRR